MNLALGSFSVEIPGPWIPGYEDRYEYPTFWVASNAFRQIAWYFLAIELELLALAHNKWDTTKWAQTWMGSTLS